MSEENPCVLERLAISARYLLVALFAAVLATGVLNGGGERAQAAAPVAAAPNYLSFTVKAAGNSKFYITDTIKKTICVYALVNESVHLVSVRKFDVDSRIVDGSVKGLPQMDGVGLTREQAQNYVKHCHPTLENLSKKFGQPMEGEMK